MQSNCLICQSEDLEKIFKVSEIPLVPNAPLEPSDFESEILVDLDIVQCQSCSLVYNRAFDPTMVEKIYTENYSSGIPSSPKILEKYKFIIEDAIGTENLEKQNIIEIGASDFTFSELLLQKGANQVIAFEPSNLFKTENPRIYHIDSFFNANEIPINTNEIGLIVIRHVVEHLPDPLSTLREISEFAPVGMKFYVEVPNVDDILLKNRFYDFFYEHVSYFSPGLLSGLMLGLGFETLKIEHLVQGQHFGLLCEKARSGQFNLKFSEFSKNLFSISDFIDYTQSFIEKLEDIIQSYERVAIYGAGNHGLGVASLLNVDRDQIECFLDLNEMKEGKFSPKTHIPIRIPELSILDQLDAIVVIASLHQDDIVATLTDKFRFKGDIWATYPNIYKL